MATKNTFDNEKLISELKKLHKILVEVYEKRFNFKYKNNEEFKLFIDKEYERNGIRNKDKKAWNDNFCHRSSYTLINKTLFMRICEDKGFILNQENYISRQNLITNYTLEELAKLPVKDIKVPCINKDIYKEDKYEILNLKDKDPKELIIDFENVLNSIIEKLDTNNFDFKHVDGSILGDVYEKFMDMETRKSIGQFYTPRFIIEYILKNTLGEADVLENPFVTVADISCGSGHFLIMAYDILKDKFLGNIEKLKERYHKDIYTIKKNGKEEQIIGKEYWVKENIHYHILKHCIYGADIDSFAVQLTTINLILKDFDNFTDDLNIIECDSLIKWEDDYNWKDLKEQLKEEQFEKTIGKENYRLEYKDLSGIEKEELINKEKAEEILALCEFWNNKFDYIVGNPPYVGHKQLSINYKEWLLKNYSDVFKDKADLSFCFFYRIIKNLSRQGKSAIITSRYFMESPTGKGLRSFLQNQSNIMQIVDFYGAEIFKGVGVATSIYMFKNYEDKQNEISVYKLLNDTFIFEDSCKLKELIETHKFEKFKINQNMLESERWILISEDEYRIYKKITSLTNYKLEDIAESFQGIITGCDKAFVMSEKETIDNEIEKDLLKKWIKNSNVKRYRILESDLNLIYSDLIEDENIYGNSLRFIEKYIDRLKNRRECKTGARKWYQLQWGRDSKLFDQPKIVFPYKGKSNNFALDSNKSYCSADVYSLILKQEFKNKVSLEYLVGILNSSIYEFYFKLFAKKMGKGIYDYYPNSIMDLRVSLDSKIVEKIDKNVNEIIKNYSLIKEINVKELLEEDNLIDGFFEMKFNNVKLQENIYYLEREIDEIIATFFELDNNDINVITNMLNLKDLKNDQQLLSADEKKIYIEELLDMLRIYIGSASAEILKKINRYSDLQNIKDRFEEEIYQFEKIINVFREYDDKTKLIDIIRESINSNAYTWNAYRKDKAQHKIKKDFIKYDSEYYGLSEWPDETHNKYFNDIIDEHTEN